MYIYANFFFFLYVYFFNIVTIVMYDKKNIMNKSIFINKNY